MMFASLLELFFLGSSFFSHSSFIEPLFSELGLVECVNVITGGGERGVKAIEGLVGINFNISRLSSVFYMV